MAEIFQNKQIKAGKSKLYKLQFVYFFETMPKFREAREALLYAHSDGSIDDEELCLLYDINASKNPDFEYWNYDPFDFDAITDAEFLAEMRFEKNDIIRLANAMNIPDEITCFFYNDISVDKHEALCILLKRLAYPCRYSDMIPRFGRQVPQLCMIFNQMIDFVHTHWSHLLEDWVKPWLSPQSLRTYADVIHGKGALDNVWGFIDGTVRPCSRPRQDQRAIYNGHKKVHGIKFQSVTIPNGLIVNLFGPVEGRRHDSAMLVMSNLLQHLNTYSHDPAGNVLCLHGDPAYPLSQYLQALLD